MKIYKLSAMTEQQSRQQQVAVEAVQSAAGYIEQATGSINKSLQTLESTNVWSLLERNELMKALSGGSLVTVKDALPGAIQAMQNIMESLVLRTFTNFAMNG